MMTPRALASTLFQTYDQYKLNHLRPANCIHQPVHAELDALLHESRILSVEEAGRSIEGRSIRRVRFGSGPKTVLLWSQMHGDEPTATLALLDMFHFLVQRASQESWIGQMLEGISVHVIPLLNPDGAEVARRYTAAQIDMNRDARALATPEARILRQAQREFAPAFAFNLHDQGLSSVANTGAVTAISLLAPALDEEKSMAPVRVRAMRVGSLIARLLEEFAGGHLATYDDTFESRAFGDNMQAWGTSTLLIESGHWPDDPDKAFIRKLNFVALLTALQAIATGAYQDEGLDCYAMLRPNGKRCFDIIIRGVRVEHPAGWSHRVDLGLFYEPAAPALRTHAATAGVMIKEAGDLSDFGALQLIEGHERKISAGSLALETAMPLSQLLDSLQIYYPR